MIDINKDIGEIVIKEEVETVVIEVPAENLSPDYSSVSSVLDQLQGLFDSFGDQESETFGSDFVKEDIYSLRKEEKESNNEYIGEGVDLSCEDCVFETNTENILNLHRNYLHGTNLPVKEGSNKHVRIKSVVEKRNVST